MLKNFKKWFNEPVTWKSMFIMSGILYIIGMIICTLWELWLYWDVTVDKLHEKFHKETDIKDLKI